MVIKQTKKAAAAARQDDNHEKKSKAQIRRDKCDDQDTVTVHKASGKIPRQLEHHKAKVLLELFAGTGSVGKAFRLRGWQVVSLDISDEAHPDLTYKTDIRDWNYKAMFKKNHFTAVWSSPPCTEYSIARTTARTERNLTLADSLVAKAIEIADHFQPRFFFLENPQSGMLKSRPVMVERNMDYRDIDYCTYGAAYRKRTRIWGVRLQTLSRPQGFRNGFWEGRWQSWKLCGVRMLQQPSFQALPRTWTPRPLCRQDCAACEGGRHIRHAQRGDGWTVHQLHALPAELTAEIAFACDAALVSS